ncbi:winged helix-turn-helix transcriptional regulator [Alicyclobacillus acidiphilus]|uniref:winged helix-turn-helix transcriptional regulator n=1 Tax=Alicyclobacillus acidiphilus TaxID=182455 RepID=UPI00082F14B9|nr:helix-turn-helix domain-containing protein [Alicyclobacillus acidiphilus]
MDRSTSADECLVSSTLDIISGKWKMVILFHLMSEPNLRFTELMRRIPGITQRVLTKQLRELEQDDIIARTIYPEIPPRVEYAMTEYGQTLRPILEMMHHWGANHLHRSRARME